MGVTAPPSRKKLLYIKEYKNEISHLFLFYFNFWPATEKCYYCPFWWVAKIIHNESFFFSIWVFFHKHSGFTWQQGKGKSIYLTPLYHFYLLHRHLDISRAIAAESSPLHIAIRRTQTGNLLFPSASRDICAIYSIFPYYDNFSISW